MDKKLMTRPQKDAFYAWVHACHLYHVSHDVKYEWLKASLEIKEEEEQIAYWWRIVEYIKTTYHEIPMEQFLTAVNESKDWKELRHYENLYWEKMEDMLSDAVRLSAVNVIRLIAPHILFGDEMLLEAYCAKAPDDAAREALKQSFIKRHDEDYEKYPFSWVGNIRIWMHRKVCGTCELISFEDGVQEKLWQAFLNEFASGSELLFYEHMTDKYARSEKYTRVKYDRERAGFMMEWAGRWMTPNGIEKMPIPEAWIENNGRWDVCKLNMYDGLSNMDMMMHIVGWDMHADVVRNEYGITGYAYLKELPEVEQNVSAEDRVLRAFHAAFNGKMPWSDIAPLISENCHYYSDGSGKDITGRGQIVAFLEDLNRRINTPELQYHAHYARLQKPECDPKLLEHKEGERVLALWQGELGEYYDCVVFFGINEEGLADDICLRKDSRYIFRPFVPFEDEE